MPGVTVRGAEPAEYDAIGALCVAAYRADGQAPEGTGYAERLADVAGRARDAEVLVAVDGSGVPLGSVTFALPGSRMAELSRPGEAEFRMLAVEPSARGRGVGRALVLACLDRAARAGCGAVVISVPSVAAPALHLYDSLGFRRVPELDWYPVPQVSLLGMRREVPPPAAGRPG